MKRLMLACFAALNLLLLVASPIVAAPAGNSANAHACQKGGWETLARSEDPYTPFGSQGECVSFGAQGGSIVQHTPVVSNPTVIASMAYVVDVFGGSYCVSQISATGFAPNTTYTNANYFYNGNPVGVAPVETDANGNWTGSAGSDYQGSPATFQYVIDGVYSNVVTYTC